MTRKLLVGAIAAGALAVSAGTAFALSADDGPTPGASSVTTSLTDPTSTTSETPTSDTTSTSDPTAPTSTSESTSTSTPTQGGAQLSADDAARLVQGRLGGTVHEVEREYEHGRLEWKVEITASDGKTYDIRVDAQNGNVTRIEPEDSDDRGGRDDDGDRHGGDDDSGRHGGDDDRGDDHGGRHGGDDD